MPVEGSWSVSRSTNPTAWSTPAAKSTPNEATDCPSDPPRTVVTSTPWASPWGSLMIVLSRPSSTAGAAAALSPPEGRADRAQACLRTVPGARLMYAGGGVTDTERSLAVHFSGDDPVFDTVTVAWAVRCGATSADSPGGAAPATGARSLKFD